MEKTKEKRTRRSALQKELDAFAQLVEVLKPLDTTQRHRLFASAMSMLPQNHATTTGGAPGHAD